MQARLDHLKQYLRYVHLRWQLDHETDKAKQKELTLAALTHAYRTRYSYMNHWEAMRQNLDRESPRRSSASRPGCSTTSPRTSRGRSIGRDPRGDRGRGSARGSPTSSPTPSTRRRSRPTWSRSSFPPGRPGRERPAVPALAALRPLQPDRGEPLTLSVVTGTIAWYRDRPAGPLDVDATRPARRRGGPAPAGRRAAPARGEGAGPGLYDFEFDDSAAGWQDQGPGRPGGRGGARAGPACSTTPGGCSRCSSTCRRARRSSSTSGPAARTGSTGRTGRSSGR